MRGPKDQHRRVPRRRSSERGAALTEAAVSIPFFLLMFAAIVFVNKMYETKLTVMRMTKEAAWDNAMCNCGERGDPTTTTCQKPEGASATSGGATSGKADGFDSSPIEKVGGPGKEIASKSFGSTESQLEASVNADAFLGKYTKKMSSRTKVMCNESPHDGNLKGMLGAAMDSWSKW